MKQRLVLHGSREPIRDDFSCLKMLRRLSDNMDQTSVPVGPIRAENDSGSI